MTIRDITHGDVRRDVNGVTMADTSGRWSELPLDEVPPRFSFVPGTDRSKFSLLWRECEPFDIPQLLRLVRHAGWRVSAKRLDFYVRSSGWTVRAAFRNKNTIVALYAAEYLATNEANRLPCVWVHPDYRATSVPVRLLQLARLELPEKPCVAYISAADEDMRAMMTELNWTDVTDDPDNAKRREFHVRAVAGREYRSALAAGGQVRRAAQIGEP